MKGYRLPHCFQPAIILEKIENQLRKTHNRIDIQAFTRVDSASVFYLSSLSAALRCYMMMAQIGKILKERLHPFPQPSPPKSILCVTSLEEQKQISSQKLLPQSINKNSSISTDCHLFTEPYFTSPYSGSYSPYALLWQN